MSEKAKDFLSVVFAVLLTGLVFWFFGSTILSGLVLAVAGIVCLIPAALVLLPFFALYLLISLFRDFARKQTTTNLLVARQLRQVSTSMHKP